MTDLPSTPPFAGKGGEMAALAAAADTVPPRCTHFGWCGGCSFQDVSYEAQVRAKEEQARALFHAYGAVLKPIVPCGDPWYYRNKMEFAFGFERADVPVASPGGVGTGSDPAFGADRGGESGAVERPAAAERRVALGLRRKGRFYGVVNLSECFLMSEAAPRLVAAAREWAAERGLPPYHLRRHEGLLRYLVVREGKRTGDCLVLLVTATPKDEAAFTAALDDLAGRMKAAGATSLCWTVTDRQADLAVGEMRRTVFGTAGFEERMAGATFRLSPHAFFQPNVIMAERLIGRARELLGTGWPVVLDLYCGVGGVTVPLAGCAKRLIGVEMEAAAVIDAQANAALNGVSHANFIAEDALTFLRRFTQYSFLRDRWAVVLDPPRSGLHPRMPGQLLSLAPPVIVYVSCNPKKLAEDLAALSGSYRVTELVPYDFFPHTPHMEVLARLERV
jgi:23S rRNA (uracil1939-C5)-methyltransferase